MLWGQGRGWGAVSTAPLLSHTFFNIDHINALSNFLIFYFAKLIFVFWGPNQKIFQGLNDLEITGFEVIPSMQNSLYHHNLFSVCFSSKLYLLTYIIYLFDIYYITYTYLAYIIWHILLIYIMSIYNGHTMLYKFKVYNLMIWHMYTL